jgi:hypothetical protein
MLGDARVAGRAVNLVREGALRNFPDQGVLASAGADDKDSHDQGSARGDASAARQKIIAHAPRAVKGEKNARAGARRAFSLTCRMRRFSGGVSFSDV